MVLTRLAAQRGQHAGPNFPLMYHMEGGQRKGRQQNLNREEEEKKKRSTRE
jgi:hypothetical protein